MNADRLRFRRMKLLDRSLLRLKRADETIDTAVQYRIIRYSGKIGTSSSAPPRPISELSSLLFYLEAVSTTKKKLIKEGI